MPNTFEAYESEWDRSPDINGQDIWDFNGIWKRVDQRKTSKKSGYKAKRQAASDFAPALPQSRLASQQLPFKAGSVKSDSTSVTASLIDVSPQEPAEEPRQVSAQVVETTLPPPLAYHCFHRFGDVAFIFPFERNASSQVLQYAEKAALIEVSTFFSDLFALGVSDNATVLSGTSGAVVHAIAPDVIQIMLDERRKGRPDVGNQDEDEENDEQGVGWAPDHTPDALPSYSVQYVTIRDTSARKYKVLLDSISTGQIGFAPLKSIQATASSTAGFSCKSIYKLAHQLDINALQQLAVQNFEEQLDQTNVLSELFSSTCFTYPAFKDAAMKVLERD